MDRNNAMSIKFDHSSARHSLGGLKIYEVSVLGNKSKTPVLV
jgi:hypothetical protein